MKCVLATNNKGKAAEFAVLLNGFFEIVTLAEAGVTEDIPETGATFSENAIQKAEYVCAKTNLPALADDSGLCVDALGGAPGVYSARYAGTHGDDRANREKLLREMLNKNNRKAHFACVLALARPGQPTITVEGRVDGRIAYEEKGENGFGYDSVFAPFIEGEKNSRTFAQMGEGEKNGFSHRARACFTLFPGKC